jgi:hypothetical protein
LEIYGTGEIVRHLGDIVIHNGEIVYTNTIYYDIDFEWDYIYELPTDFLRLKNIYELSEGEDFDLENSFLYCDLDEVHIKYIKKVTDPDDFDPLFTEILILSLALKLLNPLAGTKNESLEDRLTFKLNELTARAKAIYRSETNTTGYSSLNNARYGSGIV